MNKNNFWYSCVALLTVLAFVILPNNSAFMNPAPDPAPFTLTSPLFKNNAYVSSGVELGCRGQNKSPALQWENPPAGTKTFAIIFQDLDVSWIHWIFQIFLLLTQGFQRTCPP